LKKDEDLTVVDARPSEPPEFASAGALHFCSWRPDLHAVHRSSSWFSRWHNTLRSTESVTAYNFRIEEPPLGVSEPG
jgi:hypothetical protein